MSETRDITTPILAALKKAGILCFRMNSGTLRVRGGYIHLAPKGTADILVLPSVGTLDITRGGSGNEYWAAGIVWIETKTLKGIEHEVQTAFQERVKRLGHLYIVARSLDDILPHIEGWR